MKTLMLFIALTASVWSSFSYSQSLQVHPLFRQGAASVPVILTPANFYSAQTTEAAAIADFKESVTVIQTSWNCHIVWVPNSNNWTCWREGMGTPLNGYATFLLNASDYPASQTCKGLEGEFIGDYHSSDQPFCANVGSTGGANPQPLLCQTTCLQGSTCARNSNGWLHYVTPQSCSSPTGPDGGTDPGEPCTENCEPTDPETPPGGGDGSDIPGTGDGPTGGNTTVGGTVTDSQGNVTNINLTMDQDFSPITNRQNETNERLKVENQNSAALVEKVNGIGQGLIEANDNLEGIRDAINGLGNPDMSGIEGKLDGIKEGIDGIKDGMGTEDEGRHAGEIADLPDVEHAINAGYDAIMDAMHTQANNELTNGLETIGERFTAFESIPQIFAMSADSCSPFSFGDINLNLCPYAPTTSNVLSWVLTILTMIFIITGVVADIKRVRMT